MEFEGNNFDYIILQNKSVKRNEYIHEFKGHTFWIECMDVVDRFLFTGSADNTIRAWNTKVL